MTATTLGANCLASRGKYSQSFGDYSIIFEDHGYLITAYIILFYSIFPSDVGINLVLLHAK